MKNMEGFIALIVVFKSDVTCMNCHFSPEIILQIQKFILALEIEPKCKRENKQDHFLDQRGSTIQAD